jgi:hypothetical protein
MAVTYLVKPAVSFGLRAGIHCFLCKKTSHHPHDISHRYCGNCHVFHDDLCCARCGRRQSEHRERDPCDFQAMIAHA